MMESWILSLVHLAALHQVGRLEVLNSFLKGTNPEQLFAAAYSTCFIGAMQSVAETQGIQIRDPSIDAT